MTPDNRRTATNNPAAADAGSAAREERARREAWRRLGYWTLAAAAVAMALAAIPETWLLGAPDAVRIPLLLWKQAVLGLLAIAYGLSLGLTLILIVLGSWALALAVPYQIYLTARWAWLRDQLREKGYDWASAGDAMRLGKHATRLPSRDELACLPGFVEDDFETLERFVDLLRAQRERYRPRPQRMASSRR